MWLALLKVLCAEKKKWEIRPHPKSKQISNLIKGFAAGNLGCLELVSTFSQLLSDQI